ncbi:MAG: conjugal transfer protein TraR, partial [Ignavibacteriaceae bacterium]|nr:conjugal transfer protein TraR [Ignavibacteriaceae bacterium]
TKMAKKTSKKSTKKVTKKKPIKKAKALKTGRPVKKAATKKTLKKVVHKTPVKKRATPIKTVSKSTSAKKTEKPVRKAVRIISAKKTKAKAPEIKFEDIVELRNKAIQKIKGYNKKDLEHFKQIILDKRDEIIEQLQNLKEQMLDPTTGEYINENSPYSLHMAEQGTDAMEREKTFLYAQRENKFLGYLEDALKRIEAGTYGICVECIDEPQHLCETCPLIPKERLEAVPHSQHCLPIKQRQERK